MFWQEEDSENKLQVSDDMVDVLFSVDCKRLPVDHAYALCAALRQAAPWIAQHDSAIATHTVHVAGSQNGWERPEHGTDQYLILSKRTKLTLRAPKQLVNRLMADLAGKELSLSGCPLTIGSGKIRPLRREATLLARYVATPSEDSEERFLDWAVTELRERGIRIRKALCGKATPLSTPHGIIHTRSLMLADLSPQHSLQLQQFGLGSHREMGCGIFIPHKAVDAVKTTA